VVVLEAGCKWHARMALDLDASAVNPRAAARPESGLGLAARARDTQSSRSNECRGSCDNDNNNDTQPSSSAVSGSG
jgi:hypothetical protein